MVYINYVRQKAKMESEQQKKAGNFPAVGLPIFKIMLELYDFLYFYFFSIIYGDMAIRSDLIRIYQRYSLLLQ